MRSLLALSNKFLGLNNMSSGFDRIVRNEKTKELWTFSDQEIKDHEEYYGIISHFIWRCFGILRLAFGLFLVSNITSIYNKMTIICAPIFILVSCNNSKIEL